MKHNLQCPRSSGWFKSKECQRFSTDGTALGADIAHTYGTTDEGEIRDIQRSREREDWEKHLTGMEEEQREWES